MLNQDVLNTALDRLSDNVNIAKLRTFVERYNVETIFVDRERLNDRQRRAIANEHGNCVGYAVRDTNTIVVMGAIAGTLDVSRFDVLAHKAKIRAEERNLYDVTLAIAPEMSPLLIWLHEVGHVVHFTDGVKHPPAWRERLTRYSSQNHLEWFAEHFVLWLSDPDFYQWCDRAGAAFIEKTFNSVLS